MKNPEAPCHNCPDRHPKCHSECERYLAFVEERAKVRKVMADEAELGWALYSASKNRPTAMKHQTKRKGKW